MAEPPDCTDHSIFCVDQFGNPIPGCCSGVDLDSIYCCTNEVDGFISCTDTACSVTGPGCTFKFRPFDDDGRPLLKSPLNATTLSPWVKIAFEQY